jgi:soluble lytic murein transglycosylase-like protein
MTTAQIIGIIETEARANGLEPAWMVRIAEIESALNPNAKNPSGASGLFQIMPFHKVQNVFDPLVNTRWAMQFTKKNQLHLRSNGFPITCFTTYLAHQQGATGAVALLRAAADGKRISDLSPRLIRNISANTGGNKFQTVREFLTFWETKINRSRISGTLPASGNAEQPS